MAITTWRKLICESMGFDNETWNDIESSTLTDEELDKEFNCGFGSSEGMPFTLWTKNRVYFPVTYDGSEEVQSVSRYPDGIPTRHFGGE